MNGKAGHNGQAVPMDGMQMLAAGQRKIEDKLDALQVTTAKLDNGLTELAARFDALKENSTDRLDVLFEFKNQHERRISNVERDYFPRSAFDLHEKQQREDMNKLGDKVEKVTIAVAKIMAVSTVGIVIANALLKAVMP